MDYDDEADETVQLETVVKIICATKGVPYEKPGAASAKPKQIVAAPKTQGILKNKPNGEGGAAQGGQSAQ